MLFERGVPVVPFRAAISLDITVVDADGISASAPSMEDIPFSWETAGINADEMRWGRVAIENAYGSELVDLPMPLRAEYYNEDGIFVTNTEDNCTTLSVSQVAATVTSTATLNNSPVDEGDAGLVFSAPNATGYIDVQSTVSSWLRYDWDGDDSHDDNPSARASFGLFKGRPALIYLREIY
jgi:MSHA biogenesis protein MshQ